MTKRVLLVGGYGNFGRFIARRLSREAELTLIVAGRSQSKARALAELLNVEWAQIDIFADIDDHLKRIKPDVLVHTSGPFQHQGYEVAEACIRNGVHYLDLADGREFVANVGRFDTAARTAGVLVVSGASTVPGLTSAVLTKYAAEFQTLDSIDFGIATAQKTNRGLATVQAVLGYAGKPFKTLIDGQMRNVYGWQGLRWRKFRGLGWRPLGNCDVPDLQLFPDRFPTLRTIRFRGGLELPPLHFVLWSLTWFVRAGIVPNLRVAAPLLLRISHLFDVFGTDDSGFYLEMNGRGADGLSKQVVFDLTARAGDGLIDPLHPRNRSGTLFGEGRCGSARRYALCWPCLPRRHLTRTRRLTDHMEREPNAWWHSGFGYHSLSVSMIWLSRWDSISQGISHFQHKSVPPIQQKRLSFHWKAQAARIDGDNDTENSEDGSLQTAPCAGTSYLGTSLSSDQCSRGSWFCPGCDVGNGAGLVSRPTCHGRQPWLGRMPTGLTKLGLAIRILPRGQTRIHRRLPVFRRSPQLRRRHDVARRSAVGNRRPLAR